MDTQNNKYDISFFRPTTELAKINRKLTLTLLLIWGFAIFGFHIILRIIEEPTPEPAYIAYSEVWDNVKTGKSTVEENQIFVKSTLSVLGKLAIKPADRLVLDKMVSSVMFSLIPNQNKANFYNQVSEFNKIKTKITSLSDEKYVELKTKIIEQTASVIGVEKFSLEAKLIPFELITENLKSVDVNNTANVEAVMAKYLIHNQSFLTDMKFLGYPFHYFYTSVFLLVLFIVLCWVYCVRIDKIHERLGIDDTV